MCLQTNTIIPITNVKKNASNFSYLTAAFSALDSIYKINSELKKIIENGPFIDSKIRFNSTLFAPLKSILYLSLNENKQENY